MSKAYKANKAGDQDEILESSDYKYVFICWLISLEICIYVSRGERKKKRKWKMQMQLDVNRSPQELSPDAIHNIYGDHPKRKIEPDTQPCSSTKRQR